MIDGYAQEAIDAEALLNWTYIEQSAGRVSLKDFGPGGYVDSVVLVERIQALGTRIDGGGPCGHDIHPDAQAVHEWCVKHERLLIQYAVCGLRPDWIPEGPQFVAVLNNAGEPRIYSATHKDARGKLFPARWCPVLLTNLPETVAFARRLYGEWHAALCRFAQTFSGGSVRLTRFRAVGPAAPAEPWAFSGWRPQDIDKARV